MKISLRPYWLVFLLLVSCKSFYVPVKAEYEGYQVSSSLGRDSSIYHLTEPYRDSVDKSMNKVIGIAAVSLDKKKPEGSLGNFMADAMLFSSRVKFKLPVD